MADIPDYRTEAELAALREQARPSANGRIKKCCGKRCDTPFCPLCGKAVRPSHILDGLLDHCRVTICRYQKAIERRAAFLAKHPDLALHTVEHRKARNDQDASLAEKWQLWYDTLAALMEAPRPVLLPPGVTPEQAQAVLDATEDDR